MNAFRYLRKVNKSRDLMMHEKLNTGGWNGTDYGCAAAGEMGEACNIVKKMRRIESRIQPPESKQYEELRWRLGEELADTVLYVDLLAAHYDIDLWDQIVKKFNVGSALLSAPHVLVDEEAERSDHEIAHDVYSTSRGCRDIPYFLGQVEYLVEYLSRQQTDESASVSRFKQRLKRL